MPNSENKLTSPPKALLTFRVGVVGHRPNRLHGENIAAVLTDELEKALKLVRRSVESFPQRHHGLFTLEEEGPRLRALTSLAEGSDRYFAVAAMKQGYKLCCPLPFLHEEYERDFQKPHSVEHLKDSLADFRQIIASAREKQKSAGGLALFELDGKRENESEAYAAAARVILNQSDMLIVVWDGSSDLKLGGTYDTLKKALDLELSVIWINPHDPRNWAKLKNHDDLINCSKRPKILEEEKPAAFNKLIDAILQPPHHRDKTTINLRHEYFGQNKPWFNWSCGWKAFQNLLSSFSFRSGPLTVENFESQEYRDRDLPTDAPKGSSPDVAAVSTWLRSRLLAHSDWSDKLADSYAGIYRSSFIFCYLAAAAAVLLALVPLVYGEMEQFFAICEGTLVVSIFLIAYIGRKKRHWHDRWMEYRLLAELTRQLWFLIPLGGGRPLMRLAPHLRRYNDPAQSWMYWHMRSIDREAGLPEARIKPDYLEYVAGCVSKVTDDQIKFHDARAELSRRIDEHLHIAGLVTVSFTFIPIFVHIFLQEPHWMIWTVLAGFFPALSAAFAAINNQGEFARVYKRSSAMAAELKHLKKGLESLQEDKADLHSQQISEQALQIAQTMVDEILDWQVVFLDRPLELP